VSSDLVHWRQVEDALAPDELGSIWSGSAVVDWKNTAGLKKGDAPPIIAIYTAAGGLLPESADKPFTQAIAASNDRGRTFVRYTGNPVLKHVVGQNRDPKVVWHQPSKRWVMALYLDEDRFGLFASSDLKEWAPLGEVRVPGSSECPDFFEIPITGELGESRWVFWTANNTYLVGTFDGKQFVDDRGPHRFEVGPYYYAAQTFSDIPSEDGRRIQIGWIRGGFFEGMPFNQQLSVPTVLELRRFDEGLRLISRPVKELEQLRYDGGEWRGELNEKAAPLAGFAADAFEVAATIEPGKAEQIVLDLRGTELSYDAKSGRLALGDVQADVPLVDGKLKLHVLVDRTSIEVFAADGRVTITRCFKPAADNLSVMLKGNGATVNSLRWAKLRSAWHNADSR
jgi:sucrose-6-phosphate hydrolase SacC (GH32 family)